MQDWNQMPPEFCHLRLSPRTAAGPQAQVTYSMPTVAEQMGADPMSKLTTAIERLCYVLSKDRIRD